MNTKNLQIFSEVASRLSFVAVANSQGMSPSSVSRVISQIEDELGARLFQRNTRTVTLTEFGKKFLDHALIILEELDQAAEEAKGASLGAKGRLRVTASVAFAEAMLAPLLPRFQSQFPDTRLQIIPTDSNLDLIAEGIDLAIRMAPRIGGDVVVTKLFQTAYRVCATPDYIRSAGAPLEPKDLEAHSCTLYALPGFGSFWKFREKKRPGHSSACETHVAISGKIALSSAAVMRSVVLHGAGPALLADWLVKEDLASGRMVDLFPGYDVTATEFDTAAWIIYPSRQYVPLKVRVFIDFLKHQLRQQGFSPGRE